MSMLRLTGVVLLAYWQLAGATDDTMGTEGETALDGADSSDWEQFVLLGGAPKEIRAAMERFVEIEGTQEKIGMFAGVFLIMGIIIILLLLVFAFVFSLHKFCKACYSLLGDPDSVIEEGYEETTMMQGSGGASAAATGQVDEKGNPEEAEAAAPADAKAAEAGVDNPRQSEQRPSAAADAKAAEAGEAPPGGAAADEKEAEAAGGAMSPADPEGGSAGEVKVRRRRGSSPAATFWFSIQVIILMLAAILLLLGSIWLLMMNSKYDEIPEDLRVFARNLLPESEEWTIRVVQNVMNPLENRIRAMQRASTSLVEDATTLFDPLVNSLDQHFVDGQRKMREAFEVIDSTWKSPLAEDERTCNGTTVEDLLWETLIHNNVDAVTCSFNLYNLAANDGPIADWGFDEEENEGRLRISAVQIVAYIDKAVRDGTIEPGTESETRTQIGKHTLDEFEYPGRRSSPAQKMKWEMVDDLFEEDKQFDFDFQSIISQMIQGKKQLQRAIEQGALQVGIEALQGDFDAKAETALADLEEEKTKMSEKVAKYHGGANKAYMKTEARFVKHQHNKNDINLALVVPCFGIGLMALSGVILTVIGIHINASNSTAKRLTTLGVSLLWASLFGALIFTAMILAIYVVIFTPLSPPQGVCIELREIDSERDNDVSMAKIIKSCSNPYKVTQAIKRYQDKLLSSEESGQNASIKSFGAMVMEELRGIDFGDVTTELDSLTQSWHGGRDQFEASLVAIRQNHTSRVSDVTGDDWVEVLHSINSKWRNIVGGYVHQLTEGYESGLGNTLIETDNGDEPRFMRIPDDLPFLTADEEFRTPTGCGLDLYCQKAAEDGVDLEQLDGCELGADPPCQSTSELIETGKTVQFVGAIIDEEDNPVKNLNILLRAFKRNGEELDERNQRFGTTIQRLMNAVESIRMLFESLGDRLQEANEKVKTGDILVEEARRQFEAQLYANITGVTESPADMNSAEFIARTCSAIKDDFCEYFVLEMEGQNQVSCWLLIAMVFVFASAIQVLDYLDTQLEVEGDNLPEEAPPAYQPDMEDMEVPNVPEYPDDEAPPEYPPADDGASNPPPPPDDDAPAADDGDANPPPPPPEDDAAPPPPAEEDGPPTEEDGPPPEEDAPPA